MCGCGCECMRFVVCPTPPPPPPINRGVDPIQTPMQRDSPTPTNHQHYPPRHHLHHQYHQAIDAFEKAREEELIGAVDPQLYDEVLGCYRKTGAFEKVRLLGKRDAWMRGWLGLW